MQIGIFGVGRQLMIMNSISKLHFSMFRNHMELDIPAWDMIIAHFSNNNIFRFMKSAI